MELGLTTAYQVGIIFILIIVGFLLKKKNLVGDSGVRDMTNVLLNAVTPCVLISAYQKPFDPALGMGLLRCAGFAILTHAAAILIATLIFRREETKRYRINIFCAVYSNCGFMAIPLMHAILGDEGVFYGSTYIAVFTICYWTHGVVVYSGSRKELSLKKAFLNPGVLGTAASVCLFVLSIRLPGVLSESVNYIAALNTPLAMIVLGTFLAKIDLRKTFLNPALYGVSFLRLVLIPLVSVGITLLLRMEPVEAQAMLIPAVCPSATVATLFAARFSLDAEYSAELVAATTVFSIFTIPLMMGIAAMAI